jgi:hypothetical protein
MTRHAELIRLECVLEGMLFSRESSAALLPWSNRRRQPPKNAKAFVDFYVRWPSTAGKGPRSDMVASFQAYISQSVCRRMEHMEH